MYFHYAGHGLEVGGDSIILGTDFSAVEPGEALIQDFHVSSMIGLFSKARRVVMVIDTCRNHP